jgi:hypothetical protein
MNVHDLFRVASAIIPHLKVAGCKMWSRRNEIRRLFASVLVISPVKVAPAYLYGQAPFFCGKNVVLATQRPLRRILQRRSHIPLPLRTTMQP